MSFDQDPNEQANISGADLAILYDELKALKTENEQLTSVVKANHEWHQEHDEHDGYVGSELFIINIAALIQFN